jgi:hypothetical protein
VVKRRRNENEENENKYARTWTEEEKRQIKNEEKTKDFNVTLATCGTYKGKKVENKRQKEEEKSGKILHWRKKIKMKTFIIYMETFVTNLQEIRKKKKKNRKKRRGAELQHLREQKRKEKEKKERREVWHIKWYMKTLLTICRRKERQEERSTAPY